MKIQHRMKALESYAAARLLLKNDLVYPSYVMLKETTRSVLAYINEDKNGKEYSEKTKISNLLEDMPTGMIPNIDISVFDLFVDMDKAGLETILALDIETLRVIKKTLKKLMGMYLSADL